MREALAQTWVIENRSGANNTLGAAIVARAAPDGTTLLTNADIHLMARHVMKDVPYDPVADFTPISRLASSPMVFVASASFSSNATSSMSLAPSVLEMM